MHTCIFISVLVCSHVCMHVEAPFFLLSTFNFDYSCHILKYQYHISCRLFLLPLVLWISSINSPRNFTSYFLFDGILLVIVFVLWLFTPPKLDPVGIESFWETYGPPPHYIHSIEKLNDSYGDLNRSKRESADTMRRLHLVMHTHTHTHTHTHIYIYI